MPGLAPRTYPLTPGIKRIAISYRYLTLLPGKTGCVYAAKGVSSQTAPPFCADRKNSATRPCGSKGIGGCDAFMKLCLSSSRCESCPAKGEPARAGSQPCAGRGDTAGDA